jgi:hypothetical protein
MMVVVALQLDPDQTTALDNDGGRHKAACLSPSTSSRRLSEPRTRCPIFEINVTVEPEVTAQC